jgi:hypothetical protein
MYGSILENYPALQHYTADRVQDMDEYNQNREDLPLVNLVYSKLELLSEVE